MVYEWSDKQETCFRMYIDEKKSLEEIIEYFKIEHNFTPSKRAYQTQFKRWNFPSKQNPAHKNEQLVARIKELWEQNTTQREMLRILTEVDGYDIKERELMRVRTKNRWLLRVANGMKEQPADSDQEGITHLPEAMLADDPGLPEAADENMLSNGGTSNAPPPSLSLPRAVSPALSPEVIAKRQERFEKLAAQSDERWATRKRRRRTRGWAGLPADPPGPPRFPSETTIDESKVSLNLDHHMYRDIRARFQRLCEEDGVLKKTIAGPERWEAVKARLIQESTHLQGIFWENDENQDDLNKKKLALDVVCTDVTKRMRTLERRMTIAEAKNVLGINPEQSRQVRNAFYVILKEDHFTSKLEAGDDHWKELKQRWINGSDLLQSILAPGSADPHHQTKVKAMEVLCRDVMKRLRDDQTKRDPTRRKNTTATTYHNALPRYHEGSQDGLDDFPDHPHEALVHAAAHAHAHAQAEAAAHASAQSRGKVQSQLQAQAEAHALGLEHADLQIDPSLLLAAANPGLMDPSAHAPFAGDGYAEAAYANQEAPTAYVPGSTSVAVYFRVHGESDGPLKPKLWVSTLRSTSVSDLRQLALDKFPNTAVVRIFGIVKDAGSGNDVPLQIDQDEELEAYLSAINGGKPSFSVHLTTDRLMNEAWAS